MLLNPIMEMHLTRAAFSYFQGTLNGAFNEVKMLESMHKDIGQLGTTWNNILKSFNSKYNVKLTSYFIHQTPKVSYHGILWGKSIEFGDVLYIYSEADPSLKKRETALLLQAKMFTKKQVDKRQLELYLRWPNFWYLSNSVHNGNFNVDSQPNEHLGARYLLLARSSVNPDFASTMTPKQGLTANQFDYYLESELVGMLDFTRGKELIGDWGQAIKAIQNTFTNNNPTFHGVSRQLHFLCHNNNYFEISSNENDLSGDRSPKKGFWVVHIQSNISTFD